MPILEHPASDSELPHRLTTIDAGFLYAERPNQLLHIASIITFEERLDYDRLVADLRARIHLLPRYTDRIVPAPLGIAHPTWEPDPDFDIRRHVQRRVLAPPGLDQQLVELVAELHAQPLNRRRPLWEVVLIDGYRGDGSCLQTARSSREASADQPGEPRTALYTKVHHCMIDGVSGVQLLGILLDVSPKPSPVPAPGYRRRPVLPGFSRRLLSAVSDRVSTSIDRAGKLVSLASRPGRALREAQATLDALTNLLGSMITGAPATPFNGRIGNARRMGWATFSLSEIKAIKNRLGGSVNDVVLAVISGGLRRVLEARDVGPDRIELRAVVPVNVRGTHEHIKIGNHISMMVAPLPVGILDPVERLRQVRAATADLKKRKESERMKRIMELVDLIPPVFQQVLGGLPVSPQKQVNTICTNVPGPPIALYSQGVRVERMAPFVPLAYGIGLTFAILSYADTLTIGMTSDATLVPDLDSVIEPLHGSFEELWQASGLTRVSGERLVLPERQRRRVNGKRREGKLEAATLRDIR